MYKRTFFIAVVVATASVLSGAAQQATAPAAPPRLHGARHHPVGAVDQQTSGNFFVDTEGSIHPLPG